MDTLDTALSKLVAALNDSTQDHAEGKIDTSQFLQASIQAMIDARREIEIWAEVKYKEQP